MALGAAFCLGRGRRVPVSNPISLDSVPSSIPWTHDTAHPASRAVRLSNSDPTLRFTFCGTSCLMPCLRSTATRLAVHGLCRCRSYGPSVCFPLSPDHVPPYPSSGSAAQPPLYRSRSRPALVRHRSGASIPRGATLVRWTVNRVIACRMVPIILLPPPGVAEQFLPRYGSVRRRHRRWLIE